MNSGATSGARASRTAPAERRCALCCCWQLMQPGAPTYAQHVQGEWWTVDASGHRYQRWWGEDHFGNGWVRKHGHSTTGEQWDASEQMDTYYKCEPAAVYINCSACSGYPVGC